MGTFTPKSLNALLAAPANLLRTPAVLFIAESVWGEILPISRPTARASEDMSSEPKSRIAVNPLSAFFLIELRSVA